MFVVLLTICILCVVYNIDTHIYNFIWIMSVFNYQSTLRNAPYNRSHVYRMEAPKSRQRLCAQQNEHFDVSIYWCTVCGYGLEYPVFASRQGRKIFLFSENLQTCSGAKPVTSTIGTQSPVYTCILDSPVYTCIFYTCHTPSPSHLP
jgi:hypothetical protein